METEITTILEQPADEVVQFFKSRRSTGDFTEFSKQYDPLLHNVMDTAHRPYKQVNTSDGVQAKDVSRLSLPFQKIIVDRAAAFLIGDGIGLSADPDGDVDEQMLEMITATWHNNKLDYRTRQMARIWMAETEVAEYWWVEEKELFEGVKSRMRVGVWANSYGDSLMPYFDEYGDMVAFARGYKIGKEEYLDVWTEDVVVSYHKKEDWRMTERKENKMGKIPVIYYSRERPEWSDVQTLIDRYETMLSNFADANDYFASPMVKVKGEVKGFASKGEAGKVITLEENADASYLTWDQAPEAIRLEKDTLQELIFSMTQTPDISFQQMKGIGNISGIALKLMFLDAALKCLKHQEEFGEGLQRRINLIKAGMAKINPPVEGSVKMQIQPEFTFYMPSNDEETIRMLITATGGRAVMSRKTAVENNPFTINPVKEMEDIQDDEAGDFGNIIP